MKRVSKLHFGDIGKSFSMSFVLITVAWGVVSYYSFGGIFLSWQILLGNFAVSATLSALIYRFRYHRVLEYDEHQFTLRTGKNILEGNWKDFSAISLYHKGFGIFGVRLYRENPDDGSFIYLPATDLGLDPSNFRFELKKLLP